MMMADGEAFRSRASEEAWSLPLEKLDPADPGLYEADAHWPLFERLRRESPVHFTPESQVGPYWSISRYHDIMDVDIDHEAFSNAHGVAITDGTAGGELQPSFISMDPPRHDEQRKTVSPIVAPENLARLEGLIRERVCRVLDDLPVDEPFDWVDRVSIELTTQMLATLFDFPFDERRRLTRWSDVVTAEPGSGIVDSWDQRAAELGECAAYFQGLWNERVNSEPAPDLISMLAHSPATRNMPPEEFLGNIMLLIVGGNDTTRNSMSGGVYAFNLFPDQFEKLKADRNLIPSAVSEIIRWQTPLAHMRRTAIADAEVGGKTIRKGDKVVMWYLSGNRDADVITDADRLIIDRARPRQHLSFGFGVHRCVGNRLAELQLRILWEEILERFDRVEVIDEPTRVRSNLIRGYARMMVRLHPVQGK
jgi:cytochrome P450